MTRPRLILLAVVIVIAAGMFLNLPPRAIRLDVEPASAVVRGTYHVHSIRSDGSGTPREIAAAAARAGLQFVILTDHGDGRRPPDPPAYVGGVLMIDAVEISTTGGHVTALGMATAPYPLAGAPRDVVDDIARLNGISIAAHPGSAKPDLRWTDWNAPVHGVEWVNGDSEWRDEGVPELARTVLAYPFRRSEALAALIDRPEQVIRRWDEQLAMRPVVSLAGSDAHARLSEGRTTLPVPGYEQMFRVMSIGIPRLALSNDAPADADAIITAIADGNVFSTIDAVAGPAVFSFIATSGGTRVGVGGRVPVGAAVDFSVDSNAPAGARITLLKDGDSIAHADAATLRHSAPAGPGVYRVEVSLPGAPGVPPVPWILSNPIYVRPPDPSPSPLVQAPATRSVRYADGPATGWSVEQSPRAKSALDVVPTENGSEILWRYALGGTRMDGSFVALAMPAGPVADYDRVAFNIRASKPMRLAVELRIPQGEQGERWSRSIYADETLRQVDVRFDDMLARGRTSTARPDLSRVTDLLFVIDTVNTALGSSGQVWIDDVGLVSSSK